MTPEAERQFDQQVARALALAVDAILIAAAFAFGIWQVLKWH